MIYCQFMDGCITRQICFVNPSIRTQEIAQSCPTAFVGIDMDFSDTVSIVIACPLIFSVTDGVAYALQVIVAIIFIGVERGFRLGEALHKRTECLALRILHNANTHLTRFSANHCTNWWSIILVGAASTPFVGSTTRWILWITVPFSFFPQRSGTFRQSRLPDRSRVLSFVHALRWLATGAELPSLSCG
jgi:hypothetical protein